MSLSKTLGKFDEELEKDLEEVSTTGGQGSEEYNTPNAFSKDAKEDENDVAETSGYKKVKTESKFMRMAKETLLSEISYKDYKKDESATSKQKVNRAIREINSRLYKIEGFVNQNIKLKTETGVDSNRYWKSTRANLQKISEKMNRLSERLRKF